MLTHQGHGIVVVNLLFTLRFLPLSELFLQLWSVVLGLCLLQSQGYLGPDVLDNVVLRASLIYGIESAREEVVSLSEGV